METQQEIKCYYEGVRKGIYEYAWMRDGTIYVGTTGRTLKEALADVDQQEKNALEQRFGVE